MTFKSLSYVRNVIVCRGPGIKIVELLSLSVTRVLVKETKFEFVGDNGDWKINAADHVQ